MSKVISAREAIELIQDGSTVATAGFLGLVFPEDLAMELERQFLETGHPRDLTLMYAAGQGDGASKGVNRFSAPGLVKRVIGGHWGLVPKLQALALQNQIEAYNLPQGVISQMFRDIAAKRPRTISKVGLHTFVDPLHGGGRLNAATTEDLVERIHFDGETYLAFKTRPLDVAFLRGTTADADGNITMEREGLFLENLAMAMAAHNSGGRVMVQVEHLAQRHSLPPRQVKIPGILVDCVVLSRPEHHWQTFSVPYSPAFSHEIRLASEALDPIGLDERKVIARRAILELRPKALVNVGAGMPDRVARVAHEEGVLEQVTITLEPGVVGGIPASSPNFGAAVNVDALIDQPSMFDFYDGGGLDMAFLGMAQVDAAGNVNSSRFGTKLSGAGGFINISQNCKKVVFVGTFTCDGLEVSVQNQLTILKEGTCRKFVQQVEHVTFSGDYARERKQEVLYVTERCVFQLTSNGLELTEVAPGIDLEKEVLAHMDFHPRIRSPGPRWMEQRIFRDALMGLGQIDARL